MCFSQLWEQTQAENTRLRLELSGVKNENETLKHQLGSAAEQVSHIHAVTDAEKREKQIVLKKLAEMEEELKVRPGASIFVPLEGKTNLSIIGLETRNRLKISNI